MSNQHSFVLLCGIGAAAVGLLTFAPYVQALFDPPQAVNLIVGGKH